MKYKCLLFDSTIHSGDYETNSREALSELYIDFGIE